MSDTIAMEWYSELAVTKVQLEYPLIRPLTDADAEGVRHVHSYYGIMRVKVMPSLDRVAVDFDASRLTERDVEAALLRYGVPIRRKWALE